MTHISFQMSDTAIIGELYKRIEAHRKSHGLTQRDISDRLGITPKSYRAIGQGICKLSTFVALLRELSLLDGLESLVPSLALSPMDLLASQKTPSCRVQERKKVLNVESYNPKDVFLPRRTPLKVKDR